MTLSDSSFFDTRTESAEERGERMTIIASCLRYIDRGREVPEHLRVRLSEHDWQLVIDYKEHFISDIDVRR